MHYVNDAKIHSEHETVEEKGQKEPFGFLPLPPEMQARDQAVGNGFAS